MRFGSYDMPDNYDRDIQISGEGADDPKIHRVMVHLTYFVDVEADDRYEAEATVDAQLELVRVPSDWTQDEAFVRATRR